MVWSYNFRGDCPVNRRVTQELKLTSRAKFAELLPVVGKRSFRLEK